MPGASPTTASRFASRRDIFSEQGVVPEWGQAGREHTSVRGLSRLVRSRCRGQLIRLVSLRGDSRADPAVPGVHTSESKPDELASFCASARAHRGPLTRPLPVIYRLTSPCWAGKPLRQRQMRYGSGEAQTLQPMNEMMNPMTHMR